MARRAAKATMSGAKAGRPARSKAIKRPKASHQEKPKRRTKQAKQSEVKREPVRRRKRVIRRGEHALRILAWRPTPEAQRVIDTCQDVFDHTAGASGDCNKFVKAVCGLLGGNPFPAGDNADAITDHIRDVAWCARNGWIQLGEDPVAAKGVADSGRLVIAGATGADVGAAHGHVVVVVSSEQLWNGYPYASWGKLGGIGETNARMTRAFKLADLPKVSYMAKVV